MGLAGPPMSAVRNGIPTPPSSPASDTADPSLEANLIERNISPHNQQAHFSLPPTPSTSFHSSRDAVPSIRPPAPKIQGGRRFYSERNPVPRVDYHPWEDIFRGAVGIHQRGSGSSKGPTRTDHRGEGKNSARPGDILPGSHTRVPSETGKNALPREQDRNDTVENESVADPTAREKSSAVNTANLSSESILLSTPILAPPASWTLYSSELQHLAMKYIVIVLLSFLVLSGIFGVHMSFPLFVSLGVIITWYRKADGLWLDIIHHDPIIYHRNTTSIPSTHLSSDTCINAGPESVIWLNNTIGKIWPQINGELFQPVIDMLEDIMQANIPLGVQQIRIQDIGQGTEPIKILSMKWLDHDDVKEIEGFGDEDQESIGQWAYMEITFSFTNRGSAGNSLSKGSNPFLMINVGLGIQGIMSGPEVPICVELCVLRGTCYLKVQFIPTPPFVGLVALSLKGLPKVEIAVLPLNQRSVNVMDFPFTQNFVDKSIEIMARDFCAPRFITMDLPKMLAGDDIKKELSAIGVLVVCIDRARGLRGADWNGKSDCYVTLSYTNSPKVLWSSRIIFRELNPIWDEIAILPVNTDEIEAGLVVRIWDNDKVTKDDFLGGVQVGVADLVQKKGKMRTHKSTLVGNQQAQGTLKWSVGFYGIAALRRDKVRAGLDSGPHITTRVKEGVSSCDTSSEPTMPCVTSVPPSEAFPSGILSVQIHNAMNLTRNPEQKSGATTDKEEVEERDLPSAYCSIMLDYQKVYKTRIKAMTSKPFFNAGTERFVRDWRHSSVIVAVWDSRMREVDRILGVVELRLRDVFQSGSVVSQYYPVQGKGKIRISLLFRSVDVLPKMLLHADIGSIEIVNQEIDGSYIKDEEVKKAGCIIFSTPLTEERAIRETSANAKWLCNHGSSGLRMSVRDRHSSACILYFKRHQGGPKFRRDKVIAAAKFWLKDIPDGEVVSLRLNIVKPKKLDSFMQNASADNTDDLGYIELKVHFHRGLDDGIISTSSDKDLKDVIQAVRDTAIGSYKEEHKELGPDADSEIDINDYEKEKMMTEVGSTREVLSKPGSSRHVGVHTMPADTNATLSIEESGVHKDICADSDGHSSSIHNEPEIEQENLISHSSKAVYVRANSAPDHHSLFMPNHDIWLEEDQRESGVMQWKGARTLAWVGRGVKNASRGVTERFIRRRGERGENVGFGTEA